MDLEDSFEEAPKKAKAKSNDLDDVSVIEHFIINNQHAKVTKGMLVLYLETKGIRFSKSSKKDVLINKVQEYLDKQKK